MVPDRDWPPGPRRLGRFARGGAYLMAFVAGAALLVWPPAASTDLIRVIGLIGLIGGGLGGVGVLSHLWHMEWVGVVIIAVTSLGGCVIYWNAALTAAFEHGYGGRIAVAAALSIVPLAATQRFADLWTFSKKAERAKKVHRESPARRAR